MPFKIAIASGKGGTGKTTVAVNLFHFFHKHICENIQLVDCDVEEPNDRLFFAGSTIVDEKDIFQLIPEIDHASCTYCSKCSEYCEFNAIVVMPSVPFADVNASLCHSCGACKIACNVGAITEVHHTIGKITHFDTQKGKGLLQGTLNIGSAMQTMMIKAVKKEASAHSEITIYDAPPGTSCPVVETVADADLVILVTEPTPFGLHDLKLTVRLLKEIKKPFHVIVNKAGLGNDEVYKYLKKESIDLLGEIPFSTMYASTYATGKLTEKIPVEVERRYIEITRKLEKELTIHEGDNYFKW